MSDKKKVKHDEVVVVKEAEVNAGNLEDLDMEMLQGLANRGRPRPKKKD
jgi:hypothetical protein